ncbi:hypothetical protein BASA50_002891 [Batrachochytrium salamandrivorans]|uniref:Uncharacterized protein n=1 Tax=Batrachochytrium salamandrivorans TaxID=1357716 RepID=A0ABQ8FL32_9FUNG|nr:hypothetical protein BASA50_002891 [Batrachochytrium salamandrivorans]KAH9254366.1 hypothetical protein BASA81_007649 [Batrachochytrium salamandrivorans]KAH9276874.1 hypothetical protein BASA83_000385 [Batrachochytrium salamandrivorans]
MTEGNGSKRRPMGLRRTAIEPSTLAQDSSEKHLNTSTVDSPAKRAKLVEQASQQSDRQTSENNSLTASIEHSALEADHELEQNPTTDNIEGTLMFQVATGANEVEDVEQMLLRGLADIDADQLQEGVLLLRGCVHECDKMLRVRNGDVPNATEEERQLQLGAVAETLTLSTLFYWVYGYALYNLGLAEVQSQPATVSETEKIDLMEYFDAAVDRLETGLTQSNKDTLSICKIHDSLGRIKMHKAELLKEYRDQADILLIDCEKHFATVLESKLEDKDMWISMLSNISRICQNYSENDAASIDDAHRWRALSKRTWEMVLQEDDKNVDALVGLGSILLNVGDQIIESAENNSSEEDMQEAIEPLVQAADLLRKAIEITQADGHVNVPALCLLGEVCVNLGNLNEDGDDEDMDSEIALAFYTEAVQAFKTVRSADPEALPLRFAEFIQEWEGDMH